MKISEKIMGKSLTEALAILQDEKNVIYRIHRSDSSMNLLTSDYVANRLNVYIDENEKVTSVDMG